ncbi:MAG: outer membrane lipoprotein chaperone LolA [Nitrospirae bacterium]|nr:outer membrane lipoprotein chaperone LolA [Nitrospirota bacterium]
MKKFQISNFKFQIFLIYLLLTAYCLLSTFLFTVSYASTLDETADHIQKKYNETQDVQGKFSQTSYIKDLDKVEKYEGTFSISRVAGTKMRWIYSKPRDEEVIINGSDIWIYKKSEKQALRGKLGKGSYGQVPLALFSSLSNMKGDFDISLQKDDTLELKPKRQIGFIKRILLVITDKDFPIKSFTIFDTYGNKIDITIKSVKINTGLDEALFTFKPPHGVEVFELGQ